MIIFWLYKIFVLFINRRIRYKGMRERLIKYWKDTKLIKNKKLIEAFKKVPREYFILEEYKDKAYADYPLPIIAGQTISQPSTIMIMTEALEPKKTDKVLEIGAGSGYQAALLSKLCKKVYTVERIPELVNFARHNLNKANIKNVTVIEGDGTLGYKKKAPYDKIIVTAAAPKAPKELIKQLKEGGIIIIPVGYPLSCKMIKGKKIKGKLEKGSLGYFSFVELIGKEGY